MDPDFIQHAIVTLPGKPFVYWEGSDGGIVSSDGRFSDVSAKCDTRGLNAADLALCKSLLWRVPRQLANNINRGFSTLQLQSLSVSAQHPRNLLQGGTQDNGTWQNTRRTSSWNQIIYGDGGQSGFSSTNEALRFNTFTGQANDANFRNAVSIVFELFTRLVRYGMPQFSDTNRRIDAWL